MPQFEKHWLVLYTALCCCNWVLKAHAMLWGQWFRLRKSRLIPQWRVAVAVFANLAPFAIVSVENNRLLEAGSGASTFPIKPGMLWWKAITCASLDLAISFKYRFLKHHPAASFKITYTHSLTFVWSFSLLKESQRSRKLALNSLSVYLHRLATVFQCKHENRRREAYRDWIKRSQVLSLWAVWCKSA